MLLVMCFRVQKEKMVLRESEVQVENLYETFCIRNSCLLLYASGNSWTYWPSRTPRYSWSTSELYNTDVTGHTVYSLCLSF